VFVNRRYRLTLSVREKGQLRERIIESTSCADLAGAAAVALGLLLRQRSSAEPERQPGATEPAAPAVGANDGSTTPKPDTTPGPATKPEPATAAPQPSASAPEAVPPEDTDESPPDPVEAPTLTPAPEEVPSGPRRWKFVVRAPVGSIDLGPLPKPGFGLGGALGVRWDAWSVMGGARIISAQSWLRPESAAGADVGRWQVEAALCRGWRTGRLEFGPCLSVGVDRIWARGRGPDVTAQSQHALTLVLGAAGAGRLYVYDNLAIFAAATLGFETTQPRLVIAGLGEVGHVGPVQLSTVFGPEWSF
jgi:hypothetical protein